MILDYIDGEAAADLFAEIHGPELDAIIAEVTARLQRLAAEGRLDDAATTAAEAEICRRAVALGEAFLHGYIDAAVVADKAVSEARPEPLRKWPAPRRRVRRI